MKIISIILVLILLGIGFMIFKTSEQQDYQLQIEQLKANNSSLKQKNKLLDVELTVLKNRKITLLQKSEEQTLKIENLKTQHYEAIRPITHFTNDELYLFFTNIKTDSTAN